MHSSLAAIVSPLTFSHHRMRFRGHGSTLLVAGLLATSASACVTVTGGRDASPEDLVAQDVQQALSDLQELALDASGVDVSADLGNDVSLRDVPTADQQSPRDVALALDAVVQSDVREDAQKTDAQSPADLAVGPDVLAMDVAVLDGVDVPLGDVVRDPVPDFHLEDSNPNSTSFGQSVSPRDTLGQVSAWYFGHSTWSYCGSQYGFLDQMQGELDAMGLPVRVRIFGVNETGLESGNLTVTMGRTIPWLQDTATEQVWSRWAVTYRDVIILDRENRPINVYNLTVHNLGNSPDYEALKTILVQAAQP